MQSTLDELITFLRYTSKTLGEGTLTVGDINTAKLGEAAVVIEEYQKMLRKGLR